MGTIERDCICMLDATDYIRKQYRREVQACIEDLKDALELDANLRNDFAMRSEFIKDIVASNGWTSYYDQACLVMMCTMNPGAAYDMWPVVKYWSLLPYHIEDTWEWRILAIGAMYQDISDEYDCRPLSKKV